MHGLQPVAHIGQGAPDDHAHRVIQIGSAHLLLEIGEQRFFGERGFLHKCVRRRDRRGIRLSSVGVF